MAYTDYLDDVQKTYIAYYGRPADPGGLVWWADVAERAGGMAAVINPFGISPEATALQAPYAGNTLALLDSLYWQFFGRAGDYGGMVWWADLIDRHIVTLPEAMWSMVTTGPQGDDIAAVANKLTAANLFTRTIDPDLDGSNFQATYEGEGDFIAGRNFLTLYATSVKVPTQAETTAYIRTNIADPGDGILTP